MKADDLLNYYAACRSEAYEAMKSVRAQWKINHAAYACERDFSKKKDWQSRMVTPICKPKVKRATNLIKATLLRAGDYLDFDTPQRSEQDPKYKMDITRCNFTKRLVRAHLDAKWCSFIDNFSEAIEAAFGWSGIPILKFWVGYVNSGHFDMPRAEYVTTEQLALKGKAIDPFLFLWTADRKIQIEDQYVTLPELWEAVEKGDFDEKVVKELMGTDYGSKTSEQDSERLKRLGLDESQNEYRREVLLSHFWGPVYAKDGRMSSKIKVVNPFAKFIVANDKYILTDIEDNPYPDKSTPYVFKPLIKFPFRPNGKALTEDVNTIEDEINQFVNMQSDNMRWQLLGVNEIDQMSLSAQDKYQLKEIYPGVPIIRRPGSPELAFKHHEMGTDPTKAMPFLQELKAFHDADHGVTELISATPPIMDISTGGEKDARADAMSQFEGYATDLERGFFTDCMDKARDLIVQFMSDPLHDPNAQTILGPEAAQWDAMTPEDRKAMIVTEYNIRPRGISIFFDKLRKANVYTGVYKILNSLPDDVKEEVNWRPFLPKTFEVMGLDGPDAADLVLPPEEVQKRREAKAQQQQQIMQLEMQKLMAPIEGKIKMMEMGAQERTATNERNIQADIQKAMIQSSAKEKAANVTMLMKALQMALQSQQHDDRMNLDMAGLDLDRDAQNKEHLTDMMDMGVRMHESEQARKAASERRPANSK